MHTHSNDFKKNVTPDLALQILKEGNERFIRNLKQIVTCLNRLTKRQKDKVLLRSY